MEMVSKVKKIVDSVIDKTVLLLLLILVIVTSAQVISRYVFGKPLVWSEELARYVFVWIVFLSTSIAFRLNKHMTADFFVMLFPAKVQKFFSIIVSLIIAVFLIIIIYICPNIIQLTFMQTSATLSIPLGFVYLAFPVSAILMLLELFFRLILVFDKGRMET